MNQNLLNSKWGLVLTGGGAKGAYQAGALRYLAELNFQPKIIAGTSVGALNGAVIASYRPFYNAVQQLNELWTNLGEVEILKPNTEQIYHLLSYTAQTFIPTFREWMLHFLVESGILKDRTAFYDPTPIEYLVRETINPVELRRGIELWVTVFPSLKIPGLGYDWLIDFIRAKMGTGAEWLCIQDCPDHETVYNLLLASVAIPLAFPCRSVNGKNYIDGGLVDNVPLGALAARGCTHVIVIHLGSGRVWNRHDFPHQTIIEIRPQKLLNSDLKSLLNFDADRIQELKQQGYEDAKSQLEPIFKGFRSLSRLSQTQQNLISSTVELLEDEPLF